MSSSFRSILLLGLMLVAPDVSASEIKICADPDNLPLSNRRGDGFENKIMETIAGSLGRTITYVWWDDRRASALEALKSRKCDLVPSTIEGAAGVATTRSYMRSGYVFVTRPGEAAVTSFDDPALQKMTVGVQSVGDEAATPPVTALLRRGLGNNLHAYTFHGHYSDPNSAAEIVGDVARGKIDTAVLWGPFAGYFAIHRTPPLTVTPVQLKPADLQMVFAISMAVRNDDMGLLDAINGQLDRHQDDIDATLSSFGVPRIARNADQKIGQ